MSLGKLVLPKGLSTVQRLILGKRYIKQDSED